jgi:hypothetical protein
MSVPQMPQASILTNASPRPGSGIVASSIRTWNGTWIVALLILPCVIVSRLFQESEDRARGGEAGQSAAVT